MKSIMRTFVNAVTARRRAKDIRTRAEAQMRLAYDAMRASRTFEEFDRARRSHDIAYGAALRVWLIVETKLAR